MAALLAAAGMGFAPLPKARTKLSFSLGLTHSARADKEVRGCKTETFSLAFLVNELRSSRNRGQFTKIKLRVILGRHGHVT